jgi:thioredoxin 2
VSEQFIHIACASCLAANRVPAARVGEDPKCGKCGAALLDGAPAELGEAQFDQFVARTELPVLVDFWAPWCGPCRAMAPHFARAAQSLKHRVRLVKVNTEEAPGLAARYGIRAIPTLVLLKNGAEAKRMSGALDAGALERWAA